MRVELTMADLQSAALATWLRRLIMPIRESFHPFRHANGLVLRKSYAIGETWSSSHDSAACKHESKSYEFRPRATAYLVLGEGPKRVAAHSSDDAVGA